MEQQRRIALEAQLARMTRKSAKLWVGMMLAYKSQKNSPEYKQAKAQRLHLLDQIAKISKVLTPNA